MRRERGFMVATDTAKDALDPYDKRKAEDGKARAIRQMPIVSKAFTDWNGEIPQETALPSKLVDLLTIPWQEAQKNAESLRKLFIEAFPYLKTVQTTQTGAASMPSQFVVGRTGGESLAEQKQGFTGDLTISARAVGFGFTKTVPFTRSGIKEMKKLIDFLEGQASEDKVADNETKANN